MLLKGKLIKNHVLQDEEKGENYITVLMISIYTQNVE